MEKIKVMEFVQSVGDGGAETLVKDYALLMDKERFDVTVVVQHALEDSANLRHLRENGIPVIALSSQEDILKRIWRRIFWKQEMQQSPAEQATAESVLSHEIGQEESTLRKARNYARNLFFGLKFRKVLRQTGATVVHVHLDLLGCLQTISPSLKGIRLIHTCHNLPKMIYAGGEAPAARYLIRHNGLQLVALHGEMAKEMDAMFPEQKTVIIRNGVDFSRFQNPAASREEKRAELSIPADAFLVGHVGRFNPQKNHPFLVDVFQKIAEKRQDAYLLMIGAEDSSHIVKKLKDYGLEGRYQILSHRQDIPELLGAMDVFVFPSVFEGLPVSVVEAQAAGLRCIVSDQCSEEVFLTEKCIPMALGDPEMWAQAALDGDLTVETSRNLQDYDMNREIRRLEALYQMAAK